jgi:hypothetical protein
MTGKPAREPVLTERKTDEYGPYVQEWYCEPPGAGVRYRVIYETWLTAVRPPVRMIRKIELLQGEQA